MQGGCKMHACPNGSLQQQRGDRVCESSTVISIWIQATPSKVCARPFYAVPTVFLEEAEKRCMYIGSNEAAAVRCA